MVRPSLQDLFVDENHQNPFTIDDAGFDQVKLSTAEKAEWRILGCDNKSSLIKKERPKLGNVFRDDQELQTVRIIPSDHFQNEQEQ